MKPRLSFRIWFTPRTGSTMFCKALESTKVAGRAGEFFNVVSNSTLLELHQVPDYEHLRTHLWNIGSSANGVFGIKHTAYQQRYDQIFGEIYRLRKIDPTALEEHESIWEDLFPNVKHIYLSRRNKVRQAVSWWKAIKTEQWHIVPGEDQKVVPADFYKKHYDFDALLHLYKEAALRECAMEAYFEQHAITPLNLIYEDICRDLPRHIHKTLDYLGLETDVLTSARPYYQKTADTASEEWVQRFRIDLQEGWENPVW